MHNSAKYYEDKIKELQNECDLLIKEILDIKLPILLSQGVLSYEEYNFLKRKIN